MPNDSEITARAVEGNVALDTEAAPAETNHAVETSPESGELIPAKFVGKAADDVIRSYTELERTYSKVSGEKAQLQRERDELQARYAQREQELQARMRETAPAPQTTQEDPYKEFENIWESGDPKKAVRTAIERGTERVQQDLQARDGREYYYKLKTENQDFAKREPDMSVLAQKYAHLLNPKQAANREVYDLLHLAARGLRVSEYVKEEVDRAKQSSKTVRAEKQNAFSETGSAPATTDGVPFSELSREEMLAYLQRNQS